MANESMKELQAVVEVHRKAHQEAEARLFLVRSSDYRNEILASKGRSQEQYAEVVAEAEAEVAKALQDLTAAQNAVAKGRRRELVAESGKEISVVLENLAGAEEDAAKLAAALQEAYKHGQAFFDKRERAAAAFEAIGADGFERIHRIHCRLDGSWVLEGLRSDLQSLAAMGAPEAFRERVRQVHAALRSPVLKLKNGG